MKQSTRPLSDLEEVLQAVYPSRRKRARMIFQLVVPRAQGCTGSRSIMIRVIGGLIVVGVSFAITLFLLQRFGGSIDYCRSEDLIALKPPFGSYGGKAFDAPVQGPTGDSAERPTASALVLCEDQKRLGPAHSQHEDIRTAGRGRYSHWGAYVIFSSSDNSDPNANGRRYSYVPQ